MPALDSYRVLRDWKVGIPPHGDTTPSTAKWQDGDFVDGDVEPETASLEGDAATRSGAALLHLMGAALRDGEPYRPSPCEESFYRKRFDESFSWGFSKAEHPGDPNHFSV
eukprot:CAMPEP_0181258060 /NCGR_PEP_ID=MMETSP1096-20121128/50580_1 /TAXON_ID=156174 ORGANISM="Chrysochromulina ericina, Strain CCMP281" /NCGR_SAMPLE_ID=MMETSP1096 /ASSEMBLY_ACC=CAM_ASM_000453 /LENGTH=109 /DNA_ID=CAMNT_0023356427 /DNA_START=51 /DNA_END=379 /DNA_ORIENTATION=-